MKLISPDSLAETLDAINDSLFYGKILTPAQREETALWIAARQAADGSYAGMPAPTHKDSTEGATTFTGEKIRSRVGIRHILGEEACRALILLDVSTGGVPDALARATEGMVARLDPDPAAHGGYCCGICSVSYWRHLAVGGLTASEERLAAGMRWMKSLRDGNGRWGHIPYYYALLVLSDIRLESAVEEIRYAAPRLERVVKRDPGDDKYAQRRRVLAERLLSGS